MEVNLNQENLEATRSPHLFLWICKAEPFLNVFILAAVLSYALWPLLSAPNSSFPGGVDGMGHLTRIPYIADCLKHLQWPSWFPFWYNGATVTQYYPPLAFYLLVPIQMIFNNIFICYKVCCFASLFVGSIGVWYICYRWVGPLSGIGGAVLYAVQPFLIRTLVSQGSIAQGPIFALTPWLLFFTLLFLEKHNTLRWAAVVLVTGLLILSHAMHALLISIGLGILVCTLLILRQISFSDLLQWGIAIALGAGLVSFWWVPGATQMETPGVPNVLTYAARDLYTATSDWFNPLLHTTGGYYFSAAILASALLSLIWLKKSRANNQPNNEGSYLKTNILIISWLIPLLFSISLSLGDNLPFYKYIPMSGSLFPSRILSFSSLMTALLGAVFFKELVKNWSSATGKAFSYIIIGLAFFLVFTDVSPAFKTDIKDYTDTRNMLKTIPASAQAFNNGRFAWLIPMGSEISYFPMTKNLNMTDGWNIEGTPHMYTLWLHNTAISGNYCDYVIKNLKCWNTRSLFVDHRYTSLQRALIQNSFRPIARDKQKILYYNEQPSSYFMVQNRNALVIGKSAPGIEMTFPWMVQGFSNFLEDYPPQYLQQFKVIYLAEPEVRDLLKMQKIIKELAAADKTVIIDMGRSKLWPICGVNPYWEVISPSARLVSTPDSPFKKDFSLNPDPTGQAAALGNLDSVWAEMIKDDIRIPVLGYKNVGQHRVYFVGLSLGQHIDSAVKWINGSNSSSIDSKDTKDIIETIINLSKPDKQFAPPPFPVEQPIWTYNGFHFSYKSQQALPLLISVTHSPRWKAQIDGQPLEVYNLENLLMVNLPPGNHRVTFEYGMTWVGRTGVVLSLISLILVLLVGLNLTKLNKLLKNAGKDLLLRITDSHINPNDLN